MNHGKSICEHLKGIRRMIAEEYGIPLEQEECNFEGDCKGTCPRCEAELQYLEREIMKRKLEGEDMSFEAIVRRYLNEIFAIEPIDRDIETVFETQQTLGFVELEEYITKKIIFLDFDGVMDTAKHCHFLEATGMPLHDKHGVVFDPHCVLNLKRIIEETGSEIVVTSSWKELMSYKDILEMWEERGLPGFVTDVTPSSKLCRNRGDEIDAWLSECKEECQYVIIDDMWADNFNEHQVSHLIVTNPYYGIEDDTAERAIKILNKTL